MEPSANPAGKKKSRVRSGLRSDCRCRQLSRLVVRGHRRRVDASVVNVSTVGRPILSSRSRHAGAGAVSAESCEQRSAEPADVFIIAVPTPSKRQQARSRLCRTGDCDDRAAPEKSGISSCSSRRRRSAPPSKFVHGSAKASDLTMPTQSREIRHSYRGIARSGFCREVCCASWSTMTASSEESLRNALTPQRSSTRLCPKGMYLTNDRTAELAKLVENAFRDVNIAFANELSLICEKLTSTSGNIDLAKPPPRISRSTGRRYGGHCIAVDPWFIIAVAEGQTKIIRPPGGE